MGTPTLRSRPRSINAAPLPEGRFPSVASASSTPLGVNHRVMLTALSVITPLLVLMTCLDQIQAVFVAVSVRPTLAMARPVPVHSGLDYLGIHAKLLWAYAPPGHLAQPRRCQPMVDP